jgi:predicted regulator of Ras-like GTPase activity (Roadblock/LC7/MglB family)
MTMTIPFLSFFKKVKNQALAKKEVSVAAPKAVAPIEKPSSERFSKTVMPSATRILSPQDPFEVASRSSTMGDSMTSATAVASVPSTPRTVAFAVAAPAMVRPRDLPPAVALALEPTVERVIALDLGDFAAQMPANYIKPIESIDGTRRILLKASEVERGMASGKPAVSLATIYQQVPEIFLRSIAPTDEAQVQLPFKKVLEQFTSLQVRSDQERHQAVPQVETPFLKVSLEDNSRFGTPIEAVETADLPPGRVELATAEAFAAAEPEAAGNGCLQHPTSENTSVMPTRIPFKLSPNGTGGLAPESVPASSGPSVPTSFPSTPAPTRIPFKMADPSDEQRPKHEPWLTAESSARSSEAAVVPVTTSKADVKIGLPLHLILRGLPPFQLSGDPGGVPAEALVEIPFSLIEPQLAAGHISVTAKVFEMSLPAEYRSLFKAGEVGVDVSLPLQEVLKSLPTASLRMREDQEEQEAGQNFATPFSAKAEEDAQRLSVPPTSVAKPVAAVVPHVEPTPAAEVTTTQPVTPVAEKASDRPPRTPLQVALDTDDKLDAKSVVAHVNKIAGIKACAMMFGDGLSLAGSFPAEYETDGLCAMAPALMQRIETHMVETKLGALRGMTLSCVKGAVTFFMHENLCLAALHASGDLASEAREKLSRVVHELSRKYSHPV